MNYTRELLLDYTLTTTINALALRCLLVVPPLSPLVVFRRRLAKDMILQKHSLGEHLSIKNRIRASEYRTVRAGRPSTMKMKKLTLSNFLYSRLDYSRLFVGFGIVVVSNAKLVEAHQGGGWSLLYQDGAVVYTRRDNQSFVKALFISVVKICTFGGFASSAGMFSYVLPKGSLPVITFVESVLSSTLLSKYAPRKNVTELL